MIRMLNNSNFQDLNNFESDPEEFAKTFCKDMGIEDPEVGVSISNSLLFGNIAISSIFIQSRNYFVVNYF